MINWHGIFTGIGVLVGLYVATKMGKRLGLDPDEISRLALYVVVASLLGGRIVYVLSHLGEFAGNLRDIVRIDRGGLASHGALLFGIATVYAYAKWRALPAERLLDALALAVPINYLAMRIGNFLIGELYGDPTSLPWGVVFPGVDVPRHPAQLYDGLGQLIVLVFLIGQSSRLRRPGDLAWYTLIATSIVRLFSDLFRTELQALGPLTLGQVGAMLTIVLAAVMLRQRPPEEYSAPTEESAATLPP